MDIKQISVFLENRKGRLAEVLATLDEAGINIRALSLADTADFGVLRMIVNRPDDCLRELKSKQFVAQETQVIAAEIEDRPGGLHRVMRILDEADLNIEYMYAFVEKRADNAIVVFRIDEPLKAVEALVKKGIPLVTRESLETL